MDVISMSDFTKREILSILDIADDVKTAILSRREVDFHKKYGFPIQSLLKDKNITTLFVEKSTRTNYSFRSAASLCGGTIDGFSNPEDTSLGKGETWADTIAMFAGQRKHALVMRTTIEGVPRWSQEILKKDIGFLKSQDRDLGYNYSSRINPSVINGGDGKNQHPTQCLLDLMTIRELAVAQGRDKDAALDGLSIALLNDLKYGRTNSSLMSVAHLFDWELHFAHPRRFGPQQHRLDNLMRHNVPFTDHHENFLEAMGSSFIAYHSRPQKERIGEGEDLISIAEIGRINKKVYDTLQDKSPWLMHPLPIDMETFREIDFDLRHHPKNVVLRQAENGVYLRIALLALCTSVINPSRYNLNLSGDSENSACQIQELSLRDSLKILENPRSGFIEHNGLVLDHIPEGMGRRLEGILGLEKETIPISRSSYLPASDRKKDIIKIHQPYQPTTEQYEAMALVAPNITVSFVENGKVVRKVRPALGTTVVDRVDCSNKACVSNLQSENVTQKHHVIKTSEGYVLECHYCEVSELFRSIYDRNGFRYLDISHR